MIMRLYTTVFSPRHAHQFSSWQPVETWRSSHIQILFYTEWSQKFSRQQLSQTMSSNGDDLYRHTISLFLNEHAQDNLKCMWLYVGASPGFIYMITATPSSRWISFVYPHSNKQQRISWNEHRKLMTGWMLALSTWVITPASFQILQYISSMSISKISASVQQNGLLTKYAKKKELQKIVVTPVTKKQADLQREFWVDAFVGGNSCSIRHVLRVHMPPLHNIGLGRNTFIRWRRRSGWWCNIACCLPKVEELNWK